jgi:hypothetical protein
MTAPHTVTFGGGTAESPSVLILLPNPFPNSVTAGETLRTVLARINAFRAPDRQILGALSLETGRPLPLDLRIYGRLVAREEAIGSYLQAGPSSLCCSTDLTSATQRSL